MGVVLPASPVFWDSEFLPVCEHPSTAAAIIRSAAAVQAYREITNHPLEFSHKIEAGTQRTLPGLPSGRTDFDSAVLMYEGGGLELAEQFLHVASNVVGMHFIRTELSVGIENEAAAQSDAFTVQIHAEFLRQPPAGIGQ